VTVTSAWTRVSIPTQTIANPTVGFKLATSGDAIGVFLVQNENGSFTTPGIPTTATSVARAADNITATGALLAALQQPNLTVVSKINPSSMVITGGNDVPASAYFNAQHRDLGNINHTSGVAVTYNQSTAISTLNTATIGGNNKIAVTGNALGRGIALNGGAIASDSNALVGTLVTSVQMFFDGQSTFYGDLNALRFTVFTTTVPHPSLLTLSALP
jgi:hypothetical protein